LAFKFIELVKSEIRFIRENIITYIIHFRFLDSLDPIQKRARRPGPPKAFTLYISQCSVAESATLSIPYYVAQSLPEDHVPIPSLLTIFHTFSQ